MCGIVLHHQPQNGRTIIDMLEKIKHRGTDKYHHYSSAANVGYTRLPITDTTTEQVGKFANWTVFLNGEIYNYKDFGYTGNESEVLAKLFCKKGIKAVDELNGMFAIIAICDDKVYFARDRYGIKPLYYTRVNGTQYMASEIKAFLAIPKFKVTENKQYISQWMLFNNCFDRAATIFGGVIRIQPGTYGELTKDGIKLTKYWSWEYNQKHVPYNEAVANVRQLVINAIKRQTPKEVKFGVCLSGGIDSNIIATLTPDCHTFTVGFKGVDDERQQAEINAKQHYEIVYDKVRNLPETIYHTEELRVGASWSNYELHELASKYVKVLFDGTGADELFGGYIWRYDMARDYVKDVLLRTNLTYKSLPKTPFDDTFNNRLKFDAEHFMQGVLNVGDKLSMAHTIEMRVPFLDNELVDYVLTLPRSYLVEKMLLKDAFANELHPSILYGKKRGFSSPDWIDGQGNQALKWARAALTEWRNIFKPIN